VSTSPRSFAIPPAVLEREARLAAALAGMEATSPSLEPVPLREFGDALEVKDFPAAEAQCAALEAGGWAEDALALLRESRRSLPPGLPLEALVKRLGPLAEKAQARRTASWQLDTRRVPVRIAYAKLTPALDFDSGDLQRIFLRALRLEGLLPALDLGRHPRPILQMGPPLPAGVGGREEWAETVLRQAANRGPDPLMSGINRRLPEGLRIHRWIEQPAYATPVSELAEVSAWSWTCPEPLLPSARVHTERFMASATFAWDRPGKVGGQKLEKHVDLRPMVASMDWEGPVLRIRTPMDAFGATNPLKMLGAVLGIDPATLSGLVRESISLRPDPRLAQGERFEPKLRNLYEDAVLLSGGSNITLVDDEDDEPLRLG